MRKRIVLGNVASALVTFGVVLALAELEVGTITLCLIGALMMIASSTIVAIRELNGLLTRMSHVEEAVLRVSHGEAGVRLGAIEAPYDGLAFRLDQVFEMVDQASPDPGDASSQDSALN